MKRENESDGEKRGRRRIDRGRRKVGVGRQSRRKGKDKRREKESKSTTRRMDRKAQKHVKKVNGWG